MEAGPVKKGNALGFPLGNGGHPAMGSLKTPKNVVPAKKLNFGEGSHMGAMCNPCVVLGVALMQAGVGHLQPLLQQMALACPW